MYIELLDCILIENKLYMMTIISLANSIENNTLHDSIKNSLNNASAWSNISLVDIIIPITAVILGSLITWGFNKTKRRRELCSYKDMIVKWCQCSNDSIQQYISSLEKFAKDIKDNNSLNIAIYSTNIICVDKINQLPIDKILDSLILNIDDKEKDKNTYNLLSQLEFLEKISIMIMDKYKDYCSENKDIMESWNNNYKNLFRVMDDIISLDNTSLNKEEQLLRRRVREYSIPINYNRKDKKEITIDIWEKDFVDPLIELIGQSKNQIIHPKINEAIQYVYELKIAIERHNKLNNYGLVFQEIKASMQSSLEIINESISYFASHDIRKWWNL